eukprot:8076054-Alexandrium_andersonii.AAC.1
MSASLVGSEMCIRDRARKAAQHRPRGKPDPERRGRRCRRCCKCCLRLWRCLLYTSDAADDM